MSKTKHKIKIKDSKGLTYTVPLFTELNDLKKKKGKPIKVLENKKLITLYYPIGDVDDPERTPGRIKDSKGNVFALLNTGVPPYTEGLITVPDNKAKDSNVVKVLTVPAGVTRVRIAMCAGGYKVTRQESKNSDGDPIWVYAYDKNNETTTIKSSDKKVNIDVEKVKGNKAFQYGCKASFKFEQRDRGEDREKFYGCPGRDFAANLEGGSSVAPNNYYYSGYIDVTPGQEITCTVGGKCGKDDSSFCGFILYAYGIGIEN